MLRDQLKESAENLFNILNHPLEIPGVSEKTSFLQAAVEHLSDPTEHSHLSKLLKNFASHPELSTALTCELELLLRELNQ